MQNRSFSRRDLLEFSTASAVATVFAAPLRAAAAETTAVDQALIQAARKEGVVAFYTAMEIPVAETLAKAFQARYPGIAVRVKRSGAERVFQRIGKEEEIRLYEVDVVCSTDAAHFVRWKREGWLAPFLPQDAAAYLPAEQVDADGMYATAFALLSPIGYNTNLVKPEDAPKSFADLLAPKWKGKIVKANPGYSGVILTATFELARDLGWAYFEKLAQQQVTQVQSAYDPPQRLAHGESAIQADGAESDLLLLKEQGAPVEAVYATEGTPLITAPSAVFQSAPNPNAARLFQSFLFSADAQQLLIDDSGLCSFHALVREKPGRRSLSDIKLMKADPVAMAAQSEEIKARYSRLFGV
ncbi:MAG TPA: extracellular solute-binding protein [Xanthobacteraceae bacterium]